MGREVNKVLKFIKKNYDFFKAPFENQEQFQQWAEQANMTQNVRDLTDSLMPVLKKTMTFSKYIDALVGRLLGDDMQYLKYGYEKRLIEVLGHKRVLDCFIEQVMVNPAIKQWNQDHQQQVRETREIFEIFEQLKDLEENINKMEQRHRKSAQFAKDILQESYKNLNQFIDKYKSTPKIALEELIKQNQSTLKNKAIPLKKHKTLVRNIISLDIKINALATSFSYHESQHAGLQSNSIFADGVEFTKKNKTKPTESDAMLNHSDEDYVLSDEQLIGNNDLFIK